MFEFHSIQQYHEALANGQTSCVQAVNHFLEKIHSQHALNAYIHVYEAEALEKARQLDQARQSGKNPGRLHGVVIALKDVLSHKDHPLSAASAILDDFQAIYNATAVDRLLQEEAIIIGSCNCDEFAMGSTNEHSVYGKTLNAINHSRVPGGSSGGSAVAVQAGTCMVSLGSDTGGSVRQPADFCGIIGLKPTYGRISRYGLIAYASSFDSIGLFGTTTEDIALVLEVIAGKDEYDSTVSSREPDAYSLKIKDEAKVKRIGYFKEALESPALDPEIARSIHTLIDKLKTDGYQVEPVSFDLMDYIVPAYYVLTTAEASSNLSRYDGIRYGYRNNSANDLLKLYTSTRSEGFGMEVKRRILLGTFVLSAGYYDAYFGKAQQVRRLLVERTTQIFNEFDALILPTAPTTAFETGSFSRDPIAMYLADIFTVFANLTGIPAISIPIFWHSNGMPYGLQIMTNHFSELSLLQLSRQWIEQYSFRH